MSTDGTSPPLIHAGRQKRFLILTADVGFGHRGAANAVASAFADLFAGQVQVALVNPWEDKRIPGLLRNNQTDYDRLVREAPQTFRLQYRLSDARIPVAVIESAVTVMQAGVIGDLLSKHTPDVVLCTYPFYLAPLSAYRPPIPFIGIVCDVTEIHRIWFNKGAALTVVSNQEAYQEALGFGLQAARLRVTGIPVDVNFARETRPPQEIRATLGWNPNKTTVLVAGSKRIRNLEQVVNVLNQSGLAIQLVIVAGGDDALYEHFLNMEWRLEAHVYNYVKTMPEFMKASDLVISKAGGMIVSEALACGLPLLITDISPGQEEGNAEYVVRNGAGALALETEKMLEILKFWLAEDKKELAQRALAAKQLGKPGAANEIALLAWQIANQLPRRPRRTRLRLRPRMRIIRHSLNEIFLKRLR
jgi:1,2-diacylglycerol 3-beta-galactosyltransferase